MTKLYQYPFESQFIDIFGAKMHYIDVGTGPSILFLHGTPSWSFLWRNVIKTLQGAARCIAVDMIGHGKSDFPAINYDQSTQFTYLCEFIKLRDLKNLIIVGHSYGANLGVWYARTHENNTKAIAYLEPMLGAFKQWDDFNPSNAQARDFFKKFRDPALNHDLIINQNALINHAFSKSALRDFTMEEIEAYAMPFKEPERRKVLWDGGPRNLPIENTPKDFCDIVDKNYNWMKQSRMPQLFFYTDPAAFFTRSKAEEFIREANNVTGVYLGTGKYSHPEDYPMEISSKIANWVDTFILEQHEQ